DAELQALLQAVFQGPLLEQFVTAPAAKRMHHAYLGGLIEHTLSVTGLAAKIADHYPELDRDLLLTGALLHDIGKIREFSYKTVPFEYTSPGRLIGHLVIGSEMVRQEAAAVPNLAPERLDQLIHLILSHHGQHEFGSPCLPMTMEAILLHHLDNMDAKMNYIGRLSEQVEEDEYQWSDYQPLMERFLLLRGQDEKKTGTTAAKYAAPPPQQARGNTHKQGRPAEQPSPQRTLF
ncbi:MAG: HD domain-containing protein, partial [Proteobacteria bacterium]|nr:HD domain-containing protein [Pseudomonadota bacterium]